jgi:hypothetical protein
LCQRRNSVYLKFSRNYQEAAATKRQFRAEKMRKISIMETITVAVNDKTKRLKGPWSWTAEDIKLLKKLYPRGNTRKIAERLGRPLSCVRQKAYDLGMKTDVYQFWTQEDLELLAEMYSDSTPEELARCFHRSAGSVKTKARQLGLKKSDSYLKNVKSRPRKRKTIKN